MASWYFAVIIDDEGRERRLGSSLWASDADALRARLEADGVTVVRIESAVPVA
jgi:hypothetical protein